MRMRMWILLQHLAQEALFTSLHSIPPTQPAHKAELENYYCDFPCRLVGWLVGWLTTSLWAAFVCLAQMLLINFSHIRCRASFRTGLVCLVCCSLVWPGLVWVWSALVWCGLFYASFGFQRISPWERGSKPSLISETNTNFTQFSPIGDYFVRVCVCVCWGVHETYVVHVQIHLNTHIRTHSHCKQFATRVALASSPSR